MKKGSTKKASKRRAGKWPSRASLKEIPETSDANTVTFGRGPAAREKALAFMRGRGRPKKGTTPEGTATKSLRLPVKVWAEIERVAEKRGVSVHAAMREAIAKWLAA